MWKASVNFPNFIYTRVNDEDEYFKALMALMNIVPLEVKDGDFEKYDDFYPYDPDVWSKAFSGGRPYWSGVTIDDITLKPDKSEYPLILCCSSNHSYFTWIPVAEVL